MGAALVQTQRESCVQARGRHLSPACTFYLSAPDRTCQHLSPVCTCSLLPASDTCLHPLSPDNTCHLAQVAHT